MSFWPQVPWPEQALGHSAATWEKRRKKDASFMGGFLGKLGI
jgi:hypothetical protein